MPAPKLTDAQRNTLRRRLSRAGENETAPIQQPAPQEDPQESGGSGLLSFLPDPVENALGFVGRAVEAVDTPITERLGIDLPGPLGFIADELTRPSTLAIAAGGAGLAARGAASGSRALRVGSRLVEPIGGSGFGTRLAAETALSAGARGAAELATENLPEATPDPARLLIGLGAGLAGGGAAFAATRAAVRGTVGRDLLATLPQPVRARDLEAEVGTRPGIRFLRPRGVQQLGPSYEVKDALQVAGDLGRMAGSSLERVTFTADALFKSLGRTEKRADGNIYSRSIRRQGEDEFGLLQEIIEFPDRFTMTSEQRSAIDGLHELVGMVRAERIAFNVDPRLAELDVGQGFYPRGTVAKTKGRDTTARGRSEGGTRLSVGSDNPRLFRDPAEAIKRGVVYRHPLTALVEHTRLSFDMASKNHVATLLKPFGAAEADRLASSSIVAGMANLRGKLSSAIGTRIRREGALDPAARTTRAAEKAFEQAIERTVKSTRRFEQRVLAKAQAADIPTIRKDITASVQEGRFLVKALENTRQLLAGDGRQLSAVERAVFSRRDRLVTRLDEIDRLQADATAARDAVERSLGTPSPSSSAARRRNQLNIDADEVRRLDREARVLAKEASDLDAEIQKLAAQGERIITKVEGRLERRQILTDLDDAQRDQLREALRSERFAMKQEQTFKVAERELAVLEAEQRRLGRSASTAAQRETEAAGKIAASEESVATFRQKIEDLRALWEREKQIATQTPAGRATVQNAPALSGLDFAIEDAQQISRYYARGKVPDNQIGRARDVLRRGTRELIPLRAIGDASAVLNQLAAIAPSNPVLFMKNFALAIRDAFSPGAYERFLVEQGEDGAAHGLIMLGRASEPTDFQFSSWVTRVPVLKQSQRHFEAVTTRNRVDIFNQFVDTAARRGEPMSALDKERTARALNRLSGISNSRAGDIETIVEFAPNFLRSSFETIGSAAFDGTLEGSLARQYVRNLVIAGQAMVLGIAYAQGRDVRDVMNPIDTNALERGEVRLNPNFGTVRVLGQDVSVYGRFDSLARLAVVAGDASVRAISERDAKQLFDAIGFAASTKGSPLVSFASNAVQGTTFSGDDPFSIRGIAQQTLPFTVSGWLQDVDDGLSRNEATASSVLNFFGSKSRPTTSFERLTIASNSIFSKDVDQLTGQERQQLESFLPKLVERADKENERRADRGDPKAQMRVAFDEADQSRIADEASVIEAFQRGELNENQMARAIEDLQARAAIQKDEAQRVLGVEFTATQTGPQQALSAWFETFNEAEVAPGVIDFDLRDTLELELFRRIGGGEFGDAVEAQRAIDERKQAEHAPEAQFYFDAKTQIADAGYYDVRDEVFARSSGRVEAVLGRRATGYGDMAVALEVAQRQGDRVTVARLTAIKSTIDREVSRRRRILRLRNPDLDSTLLAIGRVSVPIRSQ